MGKSSKGKNSKIRCIYCQELLKQRQDRSLGSHCEYVSSGLRRRSGETQNSDDNGGLVQKASPFLKFNKREVLDNPGKVSAEIAKTFAESEWAKYRIVQDRLFESDFDREVKKILNSKKKKL